MLNLYIDGQNVTHGHTDLAEAIRDSSVQAKAVLHHRCRVEANKGALLKCYRILGFPVPADTRPHDLTATHAFTGKTARQIVLGW